MSNSESNSKGANGDPRDADELARDADARRERIGDTLGQLEGKLSPDRMMDNAMGLVREHGGDLADGLQRSVKNNPLPLILTGVGIAWMMMNQREGNQRGSSYNGNDPYPSFRQPSYDTRHFDSGDSGSMGSSSSYSNSRNIGDDISRASYVDSGRTGEVTSSMEGVDTTGASALAGDAYIAEVDVDLDESGYASSSSRYGGSQDDSQGKMAQMREKSGQMGSRMREKSGELSAQARQSFASMADGAGQRADEWSNEASQFMREQPLVAGALGVALGALLGGMLPTSERERQLAKQAVDSDAGKQALQHADQAVNSATQEAEKRMDEASAKVERKVDEAESKAEADS